MAVIRKKIVVIGSTGSIGVNTLRVVEEFSDRFDIVGLAANTNISLLAAQTKRWHPRVTVVADESLKKDFVGKLEGCETKILSGPSGLVEIACLEEADIIVIAVTGSHGLMPTLSAIRSGKVIALASKEPIVMAGKLIMEEQSKFPGKILPVDSEPNAIFQCLEGKKIDEVKRLILTASGGPFYKLNRSELSNITPSEALKHPVWKMGKKISIDSATMMNKGLEVIESHFLFGLPPSKIEVLIHPGSKIHSFVEFNDGVIFAVLGRADMQLSIQNALTYPDRLPTPLSPFELPEESPFTFEKPDMERFPALKCAYEAAEAGGTYGCVLNAANEVAVDAFLSSRINFPYIVDISRQVCDKHNALPGASLDEVWEADRWARKEAGKLVQQTVHS